jgi:hypothetical protein
MKTIVYLCQNQISNLLIGVENDSKNKDFLSSRIGVFKNHSKNTLKMNLKIGVFENNYKKKPMKIVLNF